MIPGLPAGDGRLQGSAAGGPAGDSWDPLRGAAGAGWTGTNGALVAAGELRRGPRSEKSALAGAAGWTWTGTALTVAIIDDLDIDPTSFDEGVAQAAASSAIALTARAVLLIQLSITGRRAGTHVLTCAERRPARGSRPQASRRARST